MKTTMVLFAGAMLASTAFAGMSFAGMNDPLAEERYRMKYGRNTPAEEARQKAARQAEAKNVTHDVAHACCQSQPAFSSSTSEERFRLKYGRNSPARETHQRTAGQHTAMHITKCAELGHCPLVRVQTASANINTSAVAANVSDAEARFRAKYGRNTPGEEQRRSANVRVNEERLMVGSADRVPCEEECCKHGE